MVRSFSDFRRAGGFFVDTDDARNFNVMGIVEQVPKRLVSKVSIGSKSDRQREVFRRRNAMSLEWGTKMELKIGDKVIFHFKAKADSEIFMDGGMLMDYDLIIAKVHDDRFEPINGNVLVEVERIVDGENVATTDGVGVVTAVSKYMNTDYKFTVKKDRYTPSVGEEIIFDPKHAYPLEYKSHSTGGKIVAIKRKDILLCV